MKPSLFIPFLAITTIAQEAEPAPTPTFSLPAYSREEITYAQGELLQIMRDMGKIDSLNSADEWAEITPAIDILMQQLNQAGIDPQELLELNGVGVQWIEQQAARLAENGFYGSQKLAAALGVEVMPPCPYTAEELAAAEQRMITIATETLRLLEAVKDKETADAAADAIRKAESEIKELEPKRSFLDQENFLRLMSEKGYTPEKVDSIAKHLRSKNYYGSDKLRSTRL